MYSKYIGIQSFERELRAFLRASQVLSFRGCRLGKLGCYQLLKVISLCFVPFSRPKIYQQIAPGKRAPEVDFGPKHLL